MEKDLLGKVDVEKVRIKPRLDKTSKHSDDVNILVYIPPIAPDSQN